MKEIMKIFSIALFSLLLLLSSAQAGILISITRVIYPVDHSELTLSMTSNATPP